MKLATEEIRKIAQWEAVGAGYGRENPETRIRVWSLADHLRSSVDFGCDVLEEDGLSNYFVLFTYVVADVPSFSFAHSVNGLLIYLSACAPVAVAGRSSRCVDPGLSSYTPLAIAT
jgi:hypothetical protein